MENYYRHKCTQRLLTKAAQAAPPPRDGVREALDGYLSREKMHKRVEEGSTRLGLHSYITTLLFIYTELMYMTDCVTPLVQI